MWVIGGISIVIIKGAANERKDHNAYDKPNAEGSGPFFQQVLFYQYLGGIPGCQPGYGNYNEGIDEVSMVFIGNGRLPYPLVQEVKQPK
jgi:hypothetical protein